LIWLRLDEDTTSYEDLRIEWAAEENEKVKMERKTAEIKLQTAIVNRARDAADRKMFRESIRAGDDVIRQW